MYYRIENLPKAEKRALQAIELVDSLEFTQREGLSKIDWRTSDARLQHHQSHREVKNTERLLNQLDLLPSSSLPEIIRGTLQKPRARNFKYYSYYCFCVEAQLRSTSQSLTSKTGVESLESRCCLFMRFLPFRQFSTLSPAGDEIERCHTTEKGNFPETEDSRFHLSAPLPVKKLCIINKTNQWFQ